MIHPIHILTQKKVLLSFSIAKKIDEEDVKKFYDSHHKRGATDEEIDSLLRSTILKEVNEAVQNKNIPGLINASTIITKDTNDPINKNIDSINKIVSIISNKLTEKKFDNLSLCYCINSLVNLLGLTEEDFDEFHKKTSHHNPTQESDEYDEGEYDEGEYDDEDEGDTPSF